MLIKDELMTFVRSEHKSGLAKTGKPYDFTVVKLMDDDYNTLEVIAGTLSFQLDNKPVPAMLAVPGTSVVVSLSLTPKQTGGLSVILESIEIAD